MVAGWMLYFVLVSALLLGAGLLLEAAARRVGLAQRWIWASALAASTLLPLLASFRPAAPAPPAGGPTPGEGIPTLSPAISMAQPASVWSDLVAAIPPLDPLLIGLWLGASAALLLIGVISAVRVTRAMRRWEPVGNATPHILISEATGPAVIGFLGGAIVLPRWAIAGDPELCRLMLAHEEEHLRARDPALLLAATVLAVLLPWNLPLWWQLRRLRLAVEVDCDARVLGRGSDLRSYATLLLEVGRRRAGLDPALLAFAEPASFLERRIRIMTDDRRRRGWFLALVLCALSTVLTAAACGVEQPTEQVEPQPPAETPVAAPTIEVTRAADPAEAPVTVGPSVDGDDQAAPNAGAAPAAPRNPATRLPVAGGAPGAIVPSQDRPEFSPRDREPELQNRSEFGRRLNEAYPTMLRAAGIGGRAVFWVRVDESGAVTNVQIYESSGHEQLDQAAMAVMRTARFSPAQKDGRPVPVWVALPVTMEPGIPEPGAVRHPQIPPPHRPEAGPLSENPAFTPREVEPELRNRAEFGAALERAYPPMLKDAGIGGRVLLWIFVTETGAVGNVRVYETSGYPQLDAAAEATMRVAQFSPAMNRGSTVPVWIAVPVTFQTAR